MDIAHPSACAYVLPVRSGAIHEDLAGELPFQTSLCTLSFQLTCVLYREPKKMMDPSLEMRKDDS